MNTLDTFYGSVATVLKSAGFIKKRTSSWYLVGNDVTVVLNFQKSSWDKNVFYINIGFWLNMLTEASFPLVQNCHFYSRVETFFPEYEKLIHSANSFLDSDEMLARFFEFFQKQLIPFLYECTKNEKLKDLMVQGVIDNKLLLPGVEDFLLSA